MESIKASLMANPNLPTSNPNHGQGSVHQEAVERGLQPTGGTCPLFPTRPQLRKWTMNSPMESILHTGKIDCMKMDKENSTVWSYIDPFSSCKNYCDKCGGPLSKLSDPPSELTVYTREGTKFAQHFGKECSNHWCRIKYYYGYSTNNGHKVYDDINSDTKCIVTSTETSFSVDFLYECKLHMLHSNATFQALSDVYNQFHNFEDSSIRRKDLNRK